MLALQPRWADSHSVLGWGPGELPAALTGARGKAGPWQQGKERVCGESPLCLPLSHAPGMCLRPTLWGGRGRLPHLGHLPTACQAAPPCCIPPGAPALMTPCLVYTCRAVIKILKQLPVEL